MRDHSTSKRPRAGLLDHTGLTLGGAQLVLGHMAAALARRFDTEILHFGSEALIPKLEKCFSLDLSGVGERRITRGKNGFGIPGANGVLAQLRENARDLTAPYDLFIYSGHEAPPFCYARCGFVYCHFPFDSSPEHWLDDRWLQRNLLDRWVRHSLYRWVWRKRMRDYARVLTNSAYSAAWIERLWETKAIVVYPPVEVTVPPVNKQNSIISVGRFTCGRRTKDQLAQVHAFREFVRCASGWTLMLAGSCSRDSGDEDYLASVKDAAAGLPVRFLVNGDRAAITCGLAKSKLFWHTTGLCVNEDEHPALAEHFGIATVEAMRAGCVPVVIDSGGQREIVENGTGGFLVSRVSELVERSLQLTRDLNLLAAMSRRAQERSAVFGREVFEQRILEIARECLGI